MNRRDYRWFGAVVCGLVILAVHIDLTSGKPCTALRDNLLTTDNCPKNCSACILFAPTASSCKPSSVAYGGSPAGVLNVECSALTPYVVRGSTAECDLTYVCLQPRGENKERSVLPMDLVTRVSNFTYPRGVTIANFRGITSTSRAKGTYSRAVVDMRVFDTPSAITEMMLTDVKLAPGALDGVTMGTRWEFPIFSNLNLDAVPMQFLKMTSINALDLTKNNIKEFPDHAAWKNVTFIDLSDNLLTDFTASVPVIRQLALSRNPLKDVPKIIYSLPSLYELWLDGCNLTNVHLNKTEYSYLTSRKTLYAGWTVSKCRDGYETQFIHSSATVCVQVGNAATPTSEGASSSRVSTWVIIVSTAGTVLLICIIAFVWYQGCYCARRRHRHRLSQTDDTKESHGGLWDDDELVQWQIDYSSLSWTKVLAEGTFGTVWLGRYDNRDVVIKSMRDDRRSTKHTSAFIDEIKLMSRLENPKIVQFVGVAWRSVNTLSAVTDYMDGGDLRDYLQSSRANRASWADTLGSIAMDVAEALIYLHSLDSCIIHRDLKSRNILLDAEANAKLSDFGISRQQSLATETMTAGVGTARWMAPEVFTGGHYTTAADMYSFGVVMTELDTKQVPFFDARSSNGHKMAEVAILQLVSAGHMQPSFSPGCPSAITSIGRECLQVDASLRPSAAQVFYALRLAVTEARSVQQPE